MSTRPLSAILLAHEAPDFARIQQEWHKRPADTGITCHKFVILGRFDQLILTLADDPAQLFPAGSAVTNARAATSSSYIGRVVAPDDFDPTVWAQESPVVGLCSVRFARRILAAAGSFAFLDDYLTHRLAGTGVRHAVVSATGWEDALVLFFARDFNAIAWAAARLRAMRISDLPFADDVVTDDGFTHPCLTTSILPAFCCQWGEHWTSERTEELLDRIDADAPLNWAVRLELHPGHWRGCAEDIKRRCLEAGLPVPTLRPTFGQTDLRISDTGKDSTHGGLLRFLLEVIFRIGAETRTVIRSAETHLHPVVEDYQEDPDAGPEVDQKPKATVTGQPRQLALAEDIRERLRLHAVPPHTLGVLEETLSRVQGISDDPMHGEEFETLQRLRNAFGKATHRLPTDQDEAVSRVLQSDISEWQMMLDRCLADRFRGPYPAGDSLMMRMGSYQGAHHRFLVVMDQFAQQAYELARHSIHKLWPRCDLPDIAIATFIGNSPSPYATSHTIQYLGCGFTDVPATMICRLRDAHMIAHETGHHIVRAYFAAIPTLKIDYFSWNPLDGLGKDTCKWLEEHGLDPEEIKVLDRCWKSKSVLREIRELLADYFAYAICFPGELESHRKAGSRTLSGFFAGGSTAHLGSLQTESRLRSGGIEALLLHKGKAVMEKFEESASQAIAAISRRSKMGINLPTDLVTKRKEAIADAVRALQILSRTPELGSLLKGIDACAGHDVFPGEESGHSLLQDVRHFLQQPGPVSLEENFEFLDSLWFKLLRRRESRHLKVAASLATADC